MRAEEYNAREIAAGRVTVEQLAAFVDADELVAAVKVFQAHRGLLQDGFLGPKTRAALDAPLTIEGKATRLPGLVCVPMRGGIWWSGNAFKPYHDPWCAYVKSKGQKKRERCDCGYHPGRDGFDEPKGVHGWADAGGKMIVSIAAGEVEKVKDYANGRWVRINHGFGVKSLSGHLDRDVPKLVDRGDEVAAGTYIGPLWGKLSLPHIHYQLSVNGKWVAPVHLLQSLAAIPLIP